MTGDPQGSPQARNAPDRMMRGLLRRSLFPGACLLLSLTGVRADAPAPPGGSGPTNTLLDSWSFTDTNTWKSDLGFAPISFTYVNSQLSEIGAIFQGAKGFLVNPVVEIPGLPSMKPNLLQTPFIPLQP